MGNDRLKKKDWPELLLHGTSTNALARMRRLSSTKALYLTDDENTAYEYALENARRDGSKPVIVHFDGKVMRSATGNTLRNDLDDEGDPIVEEYIYAGPLSAAMIASVENVEVVSTERKKQ